MAPTWSFKIDVFDGLEQIDDLPIEKIQ